jgi:hypothetical protein
MTVLRGVASAQSDGIEAQMDVVVKLRIHRALQSTEETAAGVFVGKDRQSAYFITACHAVIQDDARVHSVHLQFHNSPQTFNAVVFDRYDPVLDLAVVSVPIVNLPADIQEMVRKDPALAVPVHVIGHPSAGDWSVASGTVQNLNTSTGDIHHFAMTRDNSLAEGHSGGPVFDAQGEFLGMHTESAPTYGIEAKSAEIMNQLAAWHVPTNNVNAYGSRDAQSLWKIWPNPPAETKRDTEAYFRSARSITMRVRDRRIETDGTNATVMAQSSQEFVPKNGSLQKSPEGPITLELEKRNGSWLISLVR